MKFAVFGLSITSSLGNKQATIYRALLKELHAKDHQIAFFERKNPYFDYNHDITGSDNFSICIYNSVEELYLKYLDTIRNADCVIVGSFVPEGLLVAELVCTETAGTKVFLDFDTPFTIEQLENRDYIYISGDLIKEFDLYLSFTGGDSLKILELVYSCNTARPFYGFIDPEIFYPESVEKKYDIGFLGTYCKSRKDKMRQLMFDAARAWSSGKFIVGGSAYPDLIGWPANVEKSGYIPQNELRHFYNQLRFAINISKADLCNAGFSTSFRLFEAAACGIPVISDQCEGMELFFKPGSEILITESKEDTLFYLRNLREEEIRMIGNNARKRVLMAHTSKHRAQELEQYITEVRAKAGLIFEPE